MISEEENLWINELPAHWEHRKLKFVAKVKLSNIDKKSTDNEIPVRLCNYVDVYYNERITNELEFMEATASAAQIRVLSLVEGDVLITKDSEAADDIAVSTLVDEDLPGVVCGYHLAHIRPRKYQLAGAFLNRAFSSIGIKDQFSVAANGVTRYGLGDPSIKDAIFPLPPLLEQQTIARFLDHKTALIDQYIANKKKQIELLEKLRTAIISEAVTKGLNPNSEMKDSGVEWLGDVPAHWQVLAIKRLSVVNRGASPRPIDNPKYFDCEGEYSWVRIADVTAAGMYLEDTPQKLSKLGAGYSVKLLPGELFISIAATVGKPCINKIPVCIHDGFVYFRSLKENRKFMYYIFRSGEPYKGLGKMGTQLNLNTDTIGAIKIGVPPKDEQCQIAEYLDYKNAELDRTVQQLLDQIQKIESYRTSLISEAVTGKIDVRGFKPEPRKP